MFCPQLSCATVRCTSFPIRPGCGKGTHVLEVARRKTLHVGEGWPQVGRQTVYDLRAVALFRLLLQDALALW
jgi:hypothetical protein